MPKSPTIPELKRRATIPLIGADTVGSSFDPDAAAYFTRAGVTDATAKTQISDFITSLKSASLWTNLTACWIGRSAYNAGSGTTVFELKSNTNNGTFVNGPGWSVDGITFTGSAQAVDTPLSQSMNASWSAYAVVKDGIGDTNANRRAIGTDDANGATLLFFPDTDKSATTIGCFDGSTAAVDVVAIDATQFSLLGIASSPGAQTFYQNGGEIDSVTLVLAAGTHAVQLGTSRAASESMTEGVLPIAMIYGSNAVNSTNLFQILRTTICSDLLP